MTIALQSVSAELSESLAFLVSRRSRGRRVRCTGNGHWSAGASYRSPSSECALAILARGLRRHGVRTSGSGQEGRGRAMAAEMLCARPFRASCGKAGCRQAQSEGRVARARVDTESIRASMAPDYFIVMDLGRPAYINPHPSVKSSSVLCQA
jgi:hypothetical protein